MDAGALWRIAADLMLALHLAFVGFVVFGLLLVVVGAIASWAWVRAPGFRFAHLLAIACVVLEAWLGVRCPLTVWEMALRRRAGDATYGADFIEHWLSTLLYYQAPSWVFTLAYSAFFVLVLATWWLVPPRRRR